MAGLFKAHRYLHQVEQVKFICPIDKCNSWKRERGRKRLVCRLLSSMAATTVAPRETQPLEWIKKHLRVTAGVMSKQCLLLGVIHRRRHILLYQRLLREQFRRSCQRQCRKLLLDLAATLLSISMVKASLVRVRSFTMTVAQAIMDRGRKHLQ